MQVKLNYSVLRRPRLSSQQNKWLMFNQFQRNWDKAAIGLCIYLYSLLCSWPKVFCWALTCWVTCVVEHVFVSYSSGNHKMEEVYKTVKLFLPGEDCFPGQMLHLVMVFNILFLYSFWKLYCTHNFFTEEEKTNTIHTSPA